MTIPDSVVPRLRTAMGHNDPVTGERIAATVVEVQVAIKAFLKSQVINYETLVAADAHRNTISNEDWSA